MALVEYYYNYGYNSEMHKIFYAPRWENEHKLWQGYASKHMYTITSRASGEGKSALTEIFKEYQKARDLSDDKVGNLPVPKSLVEDRNEQPSDYQGFPLWPEVNRKRFEECYPGVLEQEERHGLKDIPVPKEDDL